MSIMDDRLQWMIACAALGKIGNEGAGYRASGPEPRLFAQVAPCGFQGGYGPRRIVRAGLAEWKNVPAGAEFADRS